VVQWKRTFYASWAAQFFSLLGFSAVIPFLPLYIRTLGVTGDAATARWAGILASATGMALVVFTPIWGIIGDRFGRKPMVLRSMFCGSIVLGLMGFARSPVDLLVLRLMQGVLTGTVTASVALVASVTPSRHAGYTLGMMQAAVFAGASVGPLVGGLMADTFGYRASFAISASTLLIGGVLVKLFVEETFTPPETNGIEDDNSFAGVFAAAGFMVTLIALFQISFANRIVAPIFPLYVEQLRGTPEHVSSVTGIILSVAGLTAALSAGVMGRFGERWGHKRMLAAATFAAGLVTLPQAFVQNVTQLFMLRILFGVAAGAIMPSANCIVRAVTSRHNLGKAYGVTHSANCLGMALGPVVGGYVGAYMGLSTTFTLTAVLLVLTSGLVLWRVRSPEDTAAATV
jgi:DHA1 family multidrug resistance protein-like MFS transporter